MKKTGLLLGIFLITTGFSFQLATAQEKTKEEQEKELQILKEIDQQKKVMAEQNKTKETAEQRKEMAENKKQMSKQKEITVTIEDDLRDMEDELDSSLDNLDNLDIDFDMGNPDFFGNRLQIYNRRGSRSFHFDKPFDISSENGNYFSPSFGDNAERSEWDFSKSMVDNTFSSEYTFDVEKTVNSVVMSVRGDCKAGEIRIIITTPDGENYSDLVIDEFGNLNWRKSFNISETENQDKTGEWNFKIESNKATGYFNISLHTF